MFFLRDISALLAILIISLIGLYVLVKNPRGLENQLFALLSFAISVWNLGILGVFFFKNELLALISTKIIFIGAIFVCILFFQFTLKIRKMEFSNLALKLLWGTTIVFLLISPTNIFSKGIIKFGDAYFADANYGLGLFIIFFLVLGNYSLLLLYHGYRTTQGLQKKQLFYVFIGSLIYIAGEELVIPTLFKFPILGAYPWWNYTSILFGVITAYAILKHDLMDIRVIINRTGAWVLTIILLASGYLIAIFLYTTFISKKIDIPLLSWTVIYGIFVGEFHQRIRFFIQTTAEKKFLKSRYDYRKVLSRMSKKLAGCKTMGDIVKVINTDFINEIEARSVRIYLANENECKGKGQDAGIG